jgi:hypothetical protein
MSNEEFNPDDIAEIESSLEAVVRDSAEGYMMELIFSRADAREMMATWVQALLGDPFAMADCFRNYSLIMEEVKEALAADDRGELD